MLGLERIGAVSFSKGCYPGQEIVARARYLGKLKRKPVLLEMAGILPVIAGQPCSLHSEGQVYDAVAVDSAVGENGRTVMLAVAPLAESAKVESLEVGGMVWPSQRLAVTQEN
jgi:folate-binding Fe-S cluster repair protein YgfZ